MAQLGQLGDLSAAQVSNGFEPVPAGVYKAQVIETELAATKDGSGQLLKATFEIMDPQQAGKKVIVRYNLVNKNAQAQEIGRGQLKALATYAGHPNPNMIRNTDELHGRPVLITVSVRAGNGDYGPSNDIKSYNYVGGAPPAKPAAAPAAPKPPAAPPAAPVAAAEPPIPAFDDPVPPAPVQVQAQPDLKAAAGF